MTEEMHDKVQATVKLVASALDIPEDDLGPIHPWKTRPLGIPSNI